MILTTQREARDAKHVEGVMFKCGDCKETKPVQASGGTGYGYAADAGPDSPPICYTCCGIRDRKDMIETGRATLYLVNPKAARPKVTNWPNSLSFDVYAHRSGRHNIAQTRTDFWFIGPDGKKWHGTQYGRDSQIARCKRLANQV